MQSKWEVWAWKKNSDITVPGLGYGEEYYWVWVPCKQNIVSVLWSAFKAKRTCGCVKIEWR